MVGIMSGDRRSELKMGHRFLRPDVPGFWPSNGLVAICLISLDMVQDDRTGSGLSWEKAMVMFCT